MITANALTVGGLAVALAILALNLRTWWKAPGRDPKVLIPFATSLLWGSLMAICTGGILQWIAGVIAALVNRGGDVAVPGATGAGDGAINTGTTAALTPGGGLAVFILTVLGVIALRAAGKTEQRRMIGGIICGACLTLTAAGAGLQADSITPIVNGAGDQVIAWFGGAI